MKITKADRRIEILMRDTLIPAFETLKHETGQEIRVVIMIAAREGLVSRLEYGAVEGAIGAVGEVRVRLIDGIPDAPTRFCCQAIIKGLAPATGFSGFSLTGKIDTLAGAGEVHLRSRTNHYNQWQWSGEFVAWPREKSA